MLATRFRCVSITPLGSPVVPLEYGSATRSLGGVDRDLGRLAGRFEQRRERRRAVGVAVHEDLLHARRLRRRGRLLKLVGHRHQQPRAAVAQLACQLVGGQQRVGGRVDATDRRHGVKRDRVFGQVRGVVSKHVALAKAALGEPRRDRAHRLGQLRVGDRPAARPVDQRRLIAQLARASQARSP